MDGKRLWYTPACKRLWERFLSRIRRILGRQWLLWAALPFMQASRIKNSSRRSPPDFVSAFGSKEKYLELGRGMFVLKSGRIVAGASSYTRYREGIEIEVETIEEERKKGLAEKLGYEFDHEYTSYEVSGEERTR